MYVFVWWGKVFVLLVWCTSTRCGITRYASPFLTIAMFNLIINASLSFIESIYSEQFLASFYIQRNWNCIRIPNYQCKYWKYYLRLSKKNIKWLKIWLNLHEDSNTNNFFYTATTFIIFEKLLNFFLNDLMEWCWLTDENNSTNYNISIWNS